MDCSPPLGHEGRKIGRANIIGEQVVCVKPAVEIVETVPSSG
jgi:hypothetical protein